MTLEELKALYANGEQIGLTLEELQNSSDEVLRNYPKEMNFFMHIQPSDLDIILPPNDFVGEVPLSECVIPIIIDEQMYVRIGIYKNNRRTYATNSDEFYINDLNVLFAKDEKTPLLVVSTETIDVLIRGKLIIYLDNGTVLTLTEKGNYDYVDKIASTVFYLTNEELNKMKKSNINTVRYSLELEDNGVTPFGGNFTASNKGRTKTDFPALITEFFSE